MARKRTFTIYDKMEADGAFDTNPANIGARDGQGRQLYTGPVQFPKMVYHPEGHYSITVPGEAVVTPFGPKMVGEKRELVSKIVEDAEAYAEAKEAGWLDKPSESASKNPERLTGNELALKALPTKEPLGSASEATAGTIAAQAREIAELKAKLAEVSDL